MSWTPPPTTRWWLEGRGGGAHLVIMEEIGDAGEDPCPVPPPDRAAHAWASALSIGIVRGPGRSAVEWAEGRVMDRPAPAPRTPRKRPRRGSGTPGAEGPVAAPRGRSGGRNEPPSPDQGGEGVPRGRTRPRVPRDPAQGPAPRWHLRAGGRAIHGDLPWVAAQAVAALRDARPGDPRTTDRWP